MSRFAALKSDDDFDNEDEYSDTSHPLDMLKPQYSIQKILEIYKESPKGVNHISEEIKKLDRIYVRAIQSPVCNNFTPPTSEIYSTFFLSGKNQSRAPQSQQTKKMQNKQKQQQPKKQQNQPPAVPAVDPPVTPEKYDDTGIMWYYKDPMDHVLGPYPSSVMRTWLECRYFDKTLLIKQANVEGRFKTISSMFPNLGTAFLDDEKRKQILEESNPKMKKLMETTDSLLSFSLTEEEDNEISELLKLK